MAINSILSMLSGEMNTQDPSEVHHGDTRRQLFGDMVIALVITAILAAMALFYLVLDSKDGTDTPEIIEPTRTRPQPQDSVELSEITAQPQIEIRPPTPDIDAESLDKTPINSQASPTKKATTQKSPPSTRLQKAQKEIQVIQKTPQVSTTPANQSQPINVTDIIANTATIEDASSPNKAFDLVQMLNLAALAIEDGRLIEPRGNNAMYYYTQILNKKPSNQNAQVGIDQVAEKLLIQGQNALRNKNIPFAQRTLQVLIRFRPHFHGIEKLRSDIDRAGQTSNNILVAALDAVSDGRLISPPGNNAFVFYFDVLRNDPHNQDALQGLLDLESKLIVLALESAQKMNFTHAETLIASAEKINSDTDKTAKAREQFIEIKKANFDYLLGEIANQLNSKRYLSVREFIRQAETVYPDDPTLLTLRQELLRAQKSIKYKPGIRFNDKIGQTGRQGPSMLVLNKGSFYMGSESTEKGHRDSESPRHPVTINQTFAIAVQEISVGEFSLFIESTRYITDAQRKGLAKVFDVGTGSLVDSAGVHWRHDYLGAIAQPNLPVIHVSWNDANAYANWLQSQTNENYRLPSEVEFEYALRAGSQTVYWWGVDSPQSPLENLAGKDDVSGNEQKWLSGFDNYADGYWGIAPVGSFSANGFGVHDLGGNVSEWVADCWQASIGSLINSTPASSPGCNKRVMRGANWSSTIEQSRNAYRLGTTPSTVSVKIGFRVVRSVN